MTTPNLTINTNTNTPSTHHPPSPPPLNPQTLDLLPPLHELLARVDRHLNPPTDAPNTPSTTNPTPTAGANTPAPGTRYLDLPPLDPKDFPREVLAVKSKIRKALREVERLPEIERGEEEVESEVRALEERVRRQREMLGRLAGVAGRGRRELEGVGESGEGAGEVEMKEGGG